MTKRPSQEQLEQRHRFLMDQEAGNPEEWWWLSFADPKRPKGSQFLGVAIVAACGFMHAVDKTHALKVNPGGEVRGITYGPGWEPPATYTDRLLSEDDLNEAGLL